MTMTLTELVLLEILAGARDCELQPSSRAKPGPRGSGVHHTVHHTPAADLKRCIEAVVAAVVEVLGKPLVPFVFPVNGGLEVTLAVQWYGQLKQHHPGLDCSQLYWGTGL